MTQLKYFSYDKILSYNAKYNIVVGPRGDGKTYGSKKKAIKDAISRGDQFIYLRRYRGEVTLAAQTFFADIEGEFPDWDFKSGGSAAYMAHISTRDDKKREWTLIGYFIALSRAQQYKSVSFKKVKTIIFDEFVIEKGAVHYLPNEPAIINNFYSTVDRYEGKTRLFMLANSVAITNPMFIEYNIDVNKADKNGFIKVSDGFMVQIIEDHEFVDGVNQTWFGKFIKGTAYGEYAVGNKFQDNHDGLLGEKPASAHYVFTLEANSGTFSVWFNRADNKYYVTSKRPGNEIIFTLVPKNMEEGKTLATFNDKFLATLRTAFRHARVIFNRASTRNAFLEIFKR